MEFVLPVPCPAFAAARQARNVEWSIGVVTVILQGENAMTDQNKATQTQPQYRTARLPRSDEDRLPGERDALPPGTLGGLPTDPQGDENRDPPPNAPVIPE
jgi:hypothetical protein